ncbi:MAG: ATP-binding protein [Candidatus Excrementavichristensenella sp.]|jgi:exonuclease SbcC
MELKSAQETIRGLENKLCGMNLSATINMLGENSVEIVSLRSGETLDISDDPLSITEAVKITVPGVMEMQLSPADVDVQEIEKQIAEMKEIKDSILNKYQVHTVIELEKLAKKIKDTKFEMETEVHSLCKTDDVAKFITARETLIDGYVAEYTSIDDLKAGASDLEAELKKARETVSDVEDIPAEYLDISDPDAHLEKLQSDLKSKQNLRESALADKISAASKLESYKENISFDPAAELEKAERKFEEQKSLLRHWLNIAEVFKAQKEKLQDNPMQDITDRFIEYLSIITGGRVSSSFPERDKLNMEIYSDDRLIDYGKLSEGTKDSVSLAFRLAVLDHLFPDGGVMVFDDPLSDMDDERSAQSYELIKECAKRHQVIFLSCRDKCINELGGNFIPLD